MNEAELTALSIAIKVLTREGILAQAEVLKNLRTRLSLADGGKGEAVAKALDHCDWSGAPIGNKVIIQQAIDVLSGKPSMTNGSFHCPACGEVMKGPTHCGHCLWDADTCGYAYAAPQAECAPREAQPVGPRTTLNYDGTFDTTCAHCGGNGCFACLKSTAPTPECAPREAQPIYQYSSGYGWVDCSESDYEKMQNPKWRRIVYAAPTPERADADTAGAKPTCPHCGLTDIEFSRVCHNSACSGYAKEESFYRGWENTVAPASQERADAGKDAALTDEQIREIWLRETGFDEQAAPFAILEFARAILAADKEKK